MRALILLCLLFQGCLFQDSDGKASDLPPDEGDKSLLVAKSTTKWLLVGPSDGQCFKGELVKQAEIDGILFSAQLKDSNELRLSAGDEEIISLNMQDLDQPVPWAHIQKIQNAEVKIREGGAKFSKNGDCVLQGGFLITVTQN